MTDPMDHDEHRRFIHLTLNAMCPPISYPRYIGYENAPFDATYQEAMKSQFILDPMVEPRELATRVQSIPPASNKYVTVFGCPEGHPSDGHIPMVDCLWFDFDVDKGADDWAAEIEPLLDALSQVASSLVSDKREEYWRVVLSGHRGVHLYLDFESIELDVPKAAYERGLKKVHESVVDSLDELTVFPLRDYFDKDGSNLSALVRVPNTLHPGATERFEEPRFAVPVDMDELIALTPERYAELVSAPRLVDSWTRTPSPFARTNVLAAIQEADRNMDENLDTVYSRDNPIGVSNAKEWYEENWQTKDFGRVLDDENRWRFDKWPCLLAWPDRDDQFDYRRESHNMEFWVMARLIQYRVPYERIVEYIKDMEHPRYSRWKTTKMLDNLINNRVGIDRPAPAHSHIEGTRYVCDECNY